MKLEITKEKVLEAASKCSQAKEVLKTLFTEVFEDEVQHRLGNRYLRDGQEEYILCSCGDDKVGLVSLRGGYLWSSPDFVKRMDRVTETEFNSITGSQSVRFTLKK